jgi:hypothetical protein
MLKSPSRAQPEIYQLDVTIFLRLVIVHDKVVQVAGRLAKHDGSRAAKTALSSHESL